MSVFTNPATRAKDEADAYVQAILGVLGDRDPNDVLGETPEILDRVVEGHSESALRRPERPGKWSATHVIQHLADSDLVWAYRMRMVVAQDNPQLSGYDQDAWADRLDYGSVTPRAALEQLTVLRTLNLRLLAGLGESDFARVSSHDERGEERLDQMVNLYAGHDLVHRQQIDRILERVAGG